MVLLRAFLAWGIAGFFLLTTVVLGIAGAHEFFSEVLAGGAIATTMVGVVNKALIALATFELGVGISREYASDNGRNVYANVRRTATRFIGVGCIALVLEALIMVIKYSQLDLAGNLVYPVAILIGAGVLLMSLGVFLHLTRNDDSGQQEKVEDSAPDSSEQIKYDEAFSSLRKEMRAS